MFGLGQQYSFFFFSFPQSILISLPKKKKSRFRFLCYLHTLEKRSYTIWEERTVGEFYCEWKTSAPLTYLVLECVMSLCCSRDSLPGTVVRHSLYTSVLSIHICSDGTRRNVPLCPHLETFAFLLRFSCAVVFNGDPPESSCLLFHSCHLLQSGKCVSSFCSMPEHSALNFFFLNSVF